MRAALRNWSEEFPVAEMPEDVVREVIEARCPESEYASYLRCTFGDQLTEVEEHLDSMDEWLRLNPTAEWSAETQ